MDFNCESWYDSNHSVYLALAESVSRTLRVLMLAENISFVDVPYRLKTKDSFVDKWNKKSNEYNSIDEMTDIAGVRVITLVDSDLDKVSEIISKTFCVHEKDSVNKSQLLGSDRFGYRSIHFVCDIGKSRENLPEYLPFKGLCFEIQIRTALSHAWAEIEHDRGYKLGGELPSTLKRRFSLLSGLLESADLEFNRLTKEVEDYKNELKSSSIEDILHHETNKLSLIAYLNIKINELGLNPKDYSIEEFNKKDAWVYTILSKYNINIINDLDKIWNKNINSENVSSYFENTKGLNNLINRLLFSENPEKYFKMVKHQLNRAEFLESTFRNMERIVGTERFNQAVQNAGIKLLTKEEASKTREQLEHILRNHSNDKTLTKATPKVKVTRPKI